MKRRQKKERVKAVIYCISRKDNIKLKPRIAKDFCKHFGYKIIDWYNDKIDNNFENNCTEYNRLLNSLNDDKFDVIIAIDIDNFFKSEQMNFKEILKHKCNLIVISDKYYFRKDS